MAVRWGVLFYRLAEVLAGVIALLAIADYLYGARVGEPIFPVAPLVLAVVILLIGRFWRRLTGAV